MKNTDNQFFTEKDDIIAWLQEYNLQDKAFIENDLSVYFYELDLSNKNLSFLPIRLKIKNHLDLSCNQLISLAGCPEELNGLFDCSNNLLTDLVGGPQKVERYYCHRNPHLISLKGSPKTVEADFFLKHNLSLTSFNDGPEKVGDYIVVDCPMTDILNLTTEIDTNFILSQPKHMRIPDLEGMYTEGIHMKTFNPQELNDLKFVLREKHSLNQIISSSLNTSNSIKSTVLKNLKI